MKILKNKNEADSKYKKIKRYTVRTVLVVLGLFLLAVIDAWLRLFIISGPPLKADDQDFITDVPFNLEQIAGISKFRSCQGHDFSGKGESGEIESSRSMKHYIAPRRELVQQLDVIEIYAPFDGRVAFVMSENAGDQLILTPDSNPNWGFALFHVERLEGISRGSRVSSGQLLGYAHVKDRHDFDMALTYNSGTLLFERAFKVIFGSQHFPGPKGHYLVTPFEYMTPEVIGQFESSGFDVADMSYSKDYRDENTCDFDSAAELTKDWQYLPGLNPEGEFGEEQMPANQMPSTHRP